MRKLALAALCLAACKSAPPPAPERPPDDARAYYPLAVGNSWTYRVSGAAEAATIEIVGRDGPWFLDDHRGRFRYEPDGVRDADRYLLRTPIAVGTQWTAVDNLIVQRFEIGATDAAITTPAGSFKGCVVVRTSTPAKKGVLFFTEWTFAPRVGLVAIETRTVEANGKSLVQSSLLLSSYRVAP